MEVIASLLEASKTYGQFKVLNNINLSLSKGNILGLIGPSGAGKTTTIKALMGMEKLDSGKASVFNVDMPSREVLARIGYMGQSDALYQNLTARENLKFYGSLMGLSGNTLKESIDKYTELVKLTPAIDKLVSTFSGGMKRRLSLAITLMSKPELIILDEPTVGIDPHLRIEIWDYLRKLASQGVGIIVTTHVMDEAEKCDYVGLIIEGRIFAIDKPENLKRKFNVNTIEEVFLKAEGEAR